MPNVRVRPNNPNNSHHISLSALGRTFGIKLERGAQSIVEAPVTPSNIYNTGGVKKYGDFDPSFAHIEMRDWQGGRGGEFLSDDPTKYFDGYGWSLTPGVWHQAPQWGWGEGYYFADNLMPGANRQQPGNSVLWYGMLSTQHTARSFPDQGAAYGMARVQSWVRKIGEPPAPLTVRLMSSHSSANRPASSAYLADATLDSTSVEPLESFVWEAQLSSAAGADTTQTGTTSEDYWVEFFTTAAGNQANHWEMGYNSSAANDSTALTGDGTSNGWSAASTRNIYFRVIPTPLRRNWRFFFLEQALYAVDEQKDQATTNMHIMLNGDRGRCSTNAMTTAVLYDGTKSWETDMWAGAHMRVTYGTGISQTSPITGNDSTSLDVSLDQALSSDSQYIIYDTDEWTEISSAIVSSVGKHPATDVAVVSDIAFFAFRKQEAIGEFDWSGSTHRGIKVASTNYAHKLAAANVFGDSTFRGLYKSNPFGNVLARSEVSSGFGSTLSFVSSIWIGTSAYQVTNIVAHGGAMYAFKEDSLWKVANDNAQKIDIGLDAFASSNNGRAAASQNLSLYFGWSHSLERFSNGVIDDVGLWRGAGLKDGHQGPASVVFPLIAWTAQGVDASSGVSGMYLWNGRGWHEIYRAHSTGYSLENATFQPNPGGHPRMWMSVGGDLVSMRFPKDTLNPRNDKTVNYQHEAVMETATIDMDAAQLPKLFGKAYAVTQNLASTQARIYAEYQLDDDIGSTQWTPLGAFTRSPVDNVDIRRGNKHALRMRYRGVTENSTVPSEMHAAVVKAVARTPVRRQWTVRAVTGDFQVDQQGLDDADPDVFYMWLQDVAASAEPIYMRAAWEAMDNTYVFAEHPILSRQYTTPDGNWGGGLQLVIREIEE